MALPFFLCVFAANWLFLRQFVRFAERHRVLLDIPNERSSHQVTTVRGGGLIFVASSLIAWLIINAYFSEPPFLRGLLLGAGLVAVISFVDDVRSLSNKLRLAIHFVAAAIFVAYIPIPDFFGLPVWLVHIFWWPFALIFIAGVTNFYNFMDGIDGLAALHSLCVLVSWVLLNVGADILQTYLCLSLAFPLLAFFVHNWPPARLFMGDVGSCFIGFSFGCLAIFQAPNFHSTNNFAIWILLMMPFLFDCTFTIVLRFMKGEKWYRPHRKSMFHRLLRCGHSQAVISSVYGIMTLLMAILLSAIFSGIMQDPILLCVLFSAPYIALYCWVRWTESEHGMVTEFASTAEY